MSGQLKLKILWAKNFLGLAIDQVNVKQNLPLTVYYFWPKTEAWEQLKLELECKPWIEDEERVSLLNAAAEIMNFWRESRSTVAFQSIKDQYNNITFVNVN
jgi:30S ribosomal protein 3